jgi:hypothetical protein
VRDLLIRLLVLALVSALVAGLMRAGEWAIRRATPRREGEFRLPPYYGGAGLMSGAIAGLCLGLGVLGHMTPARHDFAPWVGLVLFFAAGGVYAVVAAANWRLWLDKDGLQLRNAWGRTRPHVRWGDVERVRPSGSSMWFELRQGGRLAIPFAALGLLETLQAARAAGVAMDDKTLEHMRRRERGEPF